MTKEQLKQEIRLNVKPNMRQDISGQVMQQVLLDIVDNLGTVSGSSDSGSTPLPGNVATRDWVEEQEYAYESDVNELSSSLDHRINTLPSMDPAGYVTKPDFNTYTGSVASTYVPKTTFNSYTGSVASTYATKTQLQQVSSSIPSLEGYATEQYVSESIAGIEFPDPDLSDYVTKEGLNEATASLSSSIATKLDKTTYTTDSSSFNSRIGALPTKDWVTGSINTATSSLSASFASALSGVEQEIPSLTGYATEQWTKDNFISGSTFTTISGSIDTRINNKLNTSTFNTYTGSINTMSSSLDSRINNKVEQTTFTTVSSSLDTRINGKADNYSVTYPTSFTGAVNCSYDMNVVVINNNSTLSPTLSLTSPVIGKVVHLVFITSSTFSSSWSLAIPTTLTVGNDSLPVYLNGARLTTGDTVTIDSADATAEMSILITSISVNIITYQN